MGAYFALITAVQKTRQHLPAGILSGRPSSAEHITERGDTEVQLAFGLTVRIPNLNVHVKEITYEAGSIKATYSLWNILVVCFRLYLEGNRVYFYFQNITPFAHQSLYCNNEESLK